MIQMLFPSFMVLKSCPGSLESTERLPTNLLLQCQKPAFVEKALANIFGIWLPKKAQMFRDTNPPMLNITYFIMCDKLLISSMHLFVITLHIPETPG